jgi:hypothetical protein
MSSGVFGLALFIMLVNFKFLSANFFSVQGSDSSVCFLFFIKLYIRVSSATLAVGIGLQFARDDTTER